MKRTHSYSLLIFSFVTVFVSAFSLLSSPRKETLSHEINPSGKELAKIYCAMCHLFPEPTLLDKSTWKEKVLPNMGWRLGMRNPGDNPYEGMDSEETQLVKAQNVYPLQAVLQKENWQKIVDYYTAASPQRPLPQKGVLPIHDSLSRFNAKEVYIGKKITPKTCMVKFDPSTSFLFIGDANNEVYAINNKLEALGLWKTKSPAVDIDFSIPDVLRFLSIGSISPSDKKEGEVSVVGPGVAGSKPPIYEFENLTRPVQFANADLNQDGIQDLIICQFGNHNGKLSWFENGDPKKEHPIINQPGARKVIVRDFNGDGNPDIIALMAQAREELLLFLNDGKGNFTEKILAQFPPVYGVSYFELADFDHDGHPDILLTNGDNWDLSPIKKYYHGIRILMNDGMNNFKEKLFIPFYGASKAMAFDFDGDGDLDIAAISFYDDPDKPEQSFMYLENKGDLRFTASTTKLAAKGKWLTMDIGDFDKDGDADIFLGSFIYNIAEFSKLVSKGTASFPQILLLKNNRFK